MKGAKKFNTFGGVFTPTLLTILGVIMYLRLGWVVGNAGLLGAWLIILISFLITLATALSMSSIVTNIRIGAGGAYAIISQSLGLEVGGSLGIPRYLSQGLAVTMYIFGFREGWLSIFPTHSPFLIDLLVFLLIYGIAYISADLAIRTQYIIMAVIVLSLVSIVIAAYQSMPNPTDEVLKWGTFRGAPESNFKGSDFWVVFAVFFPAATGIMAGANMSGELKDPRKSIPGGTLAAIGVSFVVYIGLAYWIARSATEDELVSNYNVMIEKSFWGPAVIAGVLGATFSSALASMVGSSRILFAMGQHGVVPQSKWVGFQDKSGQPRNAMLVTGALVFATMLLRDLNAIAPLVTMFFLITYAMLNVVVIIEQNLGLISFRPIFKVPRWVPWVGLVGSVVTMFIINSTISLVSVALVILVYGILSRRKLETPFEDVRSGLFLSFAEWAAKHTATLSHKQERAWKPNLLVPVEDPRDVRGVFSFLQHITYPKGSVKLMGITHDQSALELNQQLQQFSKAFQDRDVFSSWSVIKTDRFADGVNFGNQALQGAFFKPNIIFLNRLEGVKQDEAFRQIIQEAADLQLGVLLFAQHRRAGFGQLQYLNVWIRDRSPKWDLNWDTGNQDLSILIAYKLKLNWKAQIRIITVVENPETQDKARDFMRDLVENARLPHTETLVFVGEFREIVPLAPMADLNLFGIDENPDFGFVDEMVTLTQSSCVFVRDSGLENVLA